MTYKRSAGLMLNRVPYRSYECLSGIWANGVFDKVVADHGTIMWPEGSDLCSDEIYENTHFDPSI